MKKNLIYRNSEKTVGEKIPSKWINSIFIVILIVCALIPLTCLAQVKMDPDLRPEYATSITPQDNANPATVVNIILQLIAGSLIYAAGPIAVFMIALSGVNYITSHGDQNKMEEAKKTLMWAVIGLGVILISFALVSHLIRISTTGG
jgi:hypothetical protein